MGFSKSDIKYLKELNSTEISVDLLHRIVPIVVEANEDVVGPNMFLLHTVLPPEECPKGQVSKLRHAVFFRLMALWMLKEETGVNSWESWYLSKSGYDPYLAAAAKEPLIKGDGNDLIFDPERFRARMLNI